MSEQKQPQVAVVMGSDSDLSTMRKCLDKLGQFGIAYEVRVISAHRTPQEAIEYAAGAGERGIKVIIAAAGMSAALSGVLAGATPLPVIGVPIPAGALSGVDAALSTMQMPPGVPVACMAVGSPGATNAAILAAEILATSDDQLAGKVKQFKREQAEKVAEKNAKLQKEI